jgi:hypothetical protein
MQVVGEDRAIPLQVLFLHQVVLVEVVKAPMGANILLLLVLQAMLILVVEVGVVEIIAEEMVGLVL